MSKLTINTGASDNDKSGDTLRTAFTKVNANFTELYATASADVQIPAQTNNNGKYLTTNGTSLSWGTISTTTNQLVNGAHTVTVGSDGYLTVESLYVQGYLKGVDGSTGTTGQVLTRQSNGGVAWANLAALPYVKSTFTGGTATLDIFTATWVNSGGPIRLQISVSNTVNVTLQYTATSIIAGTTTSTNGGGMWTQPPSGAPFSSNNLNNLGDIQVMYLQDITNQKIYRITGMNTAGNVNPAQGSVLIEQII